MSQGPTHASNVENICKDIQRICSDNSERFVPEPSRKSVQEDILIAMRRFKHVVMWKESWHDQKQWTKTYLQEVNEEEECSRFKASGLNTGLKPTFGFKTAKPGSDNLEGFLTAVEKTLLKEAFKHQRFERQNNKTKEIYDILQRMKKSVSICVPTDKTNSTKIIQIEDCKRWVSDHLSKATDLALRAKLVALFEDAKCLLDKVKM